VRVWRAQGETRFCAELASWRGRMCSSLQRRQQQPRHKLSFASHHNAHKKHAKTHAQAHTQQRSRLRVSAYASVNKRPCILTC
jgi:hypothetical protein